MPAPAAKIAIEIAIGVAKSAAEIAEKREFSRWQNEVSSKLDDIKANTELILADLKQLRVDFKLALAEEFRIAYERDLEGVRRNINVTLAGLLPEAPLSAATKDRLLSQVDRLRTALFTVSQYGFPTLPFILSGFTTLLTTMRLAEASPQEVRASTEEMYVSFFVPAVTESVSGSFAWALARSRDEQVRLRGVITEALRPVTLGWEIRDCERITGQGGRPLFDECDCYAVTAEFTGNADDPGSMQTGPLDSSRKLGRCRNYSVGEFLRNVDPPVPRIIDWEDSLRSEVVIRQTRYKDALISAANAVALEKARSADLQEIVLSIASLMSSQTATALTGTQYSFNS